MADVKKIIDAVENGAGTKDEIAEATGYKPVSLGVDLRALEGVGVLESHREGRLKVYTIGPNYASGANDKTETETETGTTFPKTPSGEWKAGRANPDQPDADGLMPVDRGYLNNLDNWVPENTDEYVPQNGELAEIDAIISSRGVTGQHPRFLIGGPTGCGKTTLVEHIAAKNDWPVVSIQFRYSLSEADLYGSPSIRPDGATVWVDGPLTKALLASKQGPVVLLIDEVNRARPEAASALFNALDHRGRVELEGGRGGEPIQGVPEDIIVFGTINEGSPYIGTMEMDAAEKRRFGGKFSVDYLGVKFPDREAQLIVDRTPVGWELATRLVKTANQIRSMAKDGNLQIGVPTSAVLDWARTAYAFSTADMSNPVVHAGNRMVVEPYYGSGADADEVAQIIMANLDGTPVGDDEILEHEEDAPERLVCPDCGYDELATDAPEDAVTFTTCPSCGGEADLV